MVFCCNFHLHACCVWRGKITPSSYLSVDSSFLLFRQTQKLMHRKVSTQLFIITLPLLHGQVLSKETPQPQLHVLLSTARAISLMVYYHVPQLFSRVVVYNLVHQTFGRHSHTYEVDLIHPGDMTLYLHSLKEDDHPRIFLEDSPRLHVSAMVAYVISEHCR